MIGGMADVTRRMLALLAHLQTGRRFSGDELARHTGTAPRTLRRDIARLRAYGYPVETRTGPGGHYRLAAGRALPPLALDDDEAVATLVGLALVSAMVPPDPDTDAGLEAAAQRAFGTIDQLLPRSLRPKVRVLREALETAPMSGARTAPESLTRLADACQRRMVTTFDYETKNHRESRRRVEPHRLILRHLRWFLLAWDLHRADWRVFRLDRTTTIVVTEHDFQPRRLPFGSAQAFLRDGMRADRHRVVLRVDAPVQAVADAFNWQDCQVEPLGDSTKVTVWTESAAWLLVPLAHLSAEFDIEEPVELRRWFARFGGTVGRASGAVNPESAIGGGSPGA